MLLPAIEDLQRSQFSKCGCFPHVCKRRYSQFINERNQFRGRSSFFELNKKNRLKGIKAEEHVEQYERERLRKEGCPELAEKVENYSNKLGQGFDILSYNNDGSYRKIEVKATDSNSFIITANELKMSQQDSYWIYLVSEKNNEVSIRTLKRPDLNDTDKFTLSPKNYYVSFSI